MTTSICAPAAFANQQADTDAVQLDDAAVLPRLEIALLVEDEVVRQLLLVVVREQLAVANQRSGVVDDVIGVVGIADHHRHAIHFAAYALQRRCYLALHSFVEQQVFRRIARQRQLREEHKIRLQPVASFRSSIDHALRVAADVADEQIQLSKSNTERHRSNSMPYRSVSP
jgi:hypothetical protein